LLTLCVAWLLARANNKALQVARLPQAPGFSVKRRCERWIVCV
jgi:hypothetical protein